MLTGRQIASEAPCDAVVEVFLAPFGPGCLQGGVFVALARSGLQLVQGLLGGDDRLAAAVAHRGDHEIHDRAALLVQVEAHPEDCPLAGPAFRPGLGLLEQGDVAGIGAVVEIPGLLDPFRRHDAKGLHGDGGVLALPGPQLGLVGLEGGQVVAVAVLSLGPG